MIKTDNSNCKYALYAIATIFYIWILAFALPRACNRRDVPSIIVDTGTLLVAVLSAAYAREQYEGHKDEEKTKLLCEYNHRYSEDKNIEAVIKFILSHSIEDESGNLKPINRFLWKEPILTNEKEMFMRFFEELQMQIGKNNLHPKQVCSLFAYYAIEFDKNPEFRTDITDYKSTIELYSLREKMETESDKNKKEVLEKRFLEYDYAWKDFRAFATSMAELRTQIKNESHEK